MLSRADHEVSFITSGPDLFGLLNPPVTNTNGKSFEENLYTVKEGEE